MQDTEKQSMRIKTIAAILVVMFAFVLTLTFAQTKPSEPKKWDKPPAMQIDVNKTYTATIETNKGKIVLNLLPKESPKTVNNFVFLARQHFYDGTLFHRVIPGFMIQGGDPTGTGMGGPGYRFENENRTTTRRFAPGTMAMANAGLDTNGSQFFIMDANYPLNPATYTIFGELKEGQDVVHAIAASPRNAEDRPNTDVVMKSVTIEEK
jgi:cyclophilin family peptidyl-prolyl cis-trans isomerase